MPHGKAWTRGDIQHLRWYAERGFSEAEAAAVMGRSWGSIHNRAQLLGIHFHGPAGAPFANQNGTGSRFSEMRQPNKRDLHT